MGHRVAPKDKYLSSGKAWDGEWCFTLILGAKKIGAKTTGKKEPGLKFCVAGTQATGGSRDMRQESIAENQLWMEILSQSQPRMNDQRQAGDYHRCHLERCSGCNLEVGWGGSRVQAGIQVVLGSRGEDIWLLEGVTQVKSYSAVSLLINFSTPWELGNFISALRKRKQRLEAVK